MEVSQLVCGSCEDAGVGGEGRKGEGQGRWDCGGYLCRYEHGYEGSEGEGEGSEYGCGFGGFGRVQWAIERGGLEQRRYFMYATNVHWQRSERVREACNDEPSGYEGEGEECLWRCCRGTYMCLYTCFTSRFPNRSFLCDERRASPAQARPSRRSVVVIPDCSPRRVPPLT